MSNQNIHRTPSVGSVRQAAMRTVVLGNEKVVPGGAIVDGSKSQDPGNSSPDEDKLRAGLIMGKITASKKYAPSVIGSLQGDIIATATALTLTAAEAAYLVDRIGASGTFLLVGPPTAGGTVASEQITYSAVNTSTGVVTISATTAAFEASSIVTPEDGSEAFKYVRGNGYPLKVTDQDKLDIDVDDAHPVIGGHLQADQLIPWPADTSLQDYIRTQLNLVAGTFTFDDEYN